MSRDVYTIIHQDYISDPNDGHRRMANVKVYWGQGAEHPRQSHHLRLS